MTDERGGGNSGRRPFEEAVTQTRAGAGATPVPSRRIGQFHIKDVLASGGMGVVYRAVQEQPRRTVAVKVMRQGIASRSAMRRFEYESQVLARLRHPGIAQVIDAGTHDDGSGPVPYFAMEYVPNAKPITQYAKDKSLGTRERLELLLKVCDAVHHGHQKGIIHRDLKPANILVDSHGEVKVIDFGVARGTDSDLAVTTLQTEVGQLIGTLQYMSPEQCEADPDAIDARSDIYTLGVVLYELLTGQLPYTLSATHVFRSTKVIREETPTGLSKVDRTLRGDVETIVLQALEKDPDRRYASASDLAEDIRSYLNGEPIRARPPSAVYQAQLFARRHRAKLGTTAVLVLIAVVAVALVWRSSQRANQAETAAAEALERASQAEAAASVRQDGSNDGRHPTDMVGKTPGEFFLTTLKGRTMGTADLPEHPATVLNFVAANCPYCFKQVPLVERIRAEYEPQGVRFVNIILTLVGKEYTAQEAWDVFYKYGSRIEVAKADNRQMEELFHVRGYPTLAVLDDTGLVRYVRVGADGAIMSLLRGQLDALLLDMPTPEEMLAKEEELHRQTLENNRKSLGEGHRDTLRAMENLAVTLTAQGEHDEAEELHRDMLRIRRQFLGETDAMTLESMHELALILQQREKPAEAEDLHRQVLEARRRMLGEDHPDTRLTMAHLGRALQAQGKSEGAGPYIAELIELRRREASAQDASADKHNSYAWLLLTCEPEGLRDPQRALTAASTAAALSGRHDAEILDTLAMAHKMTGDLPAAIETQKEAIALLQPGDFMARMPYEQILAEYYREAGELEALEGWYRDMLARTRSATPAGSLAVGVALSSLGDFLIERGEYIEAESAFREVLEIIRGALPEGHWRIADVESTLGLTLVGQERFDEAEPLVIDSLNRLKDDPGVPAEQRAAARQRVVRLYTDWEKPDEAARFRSAKD